MADITFLLIIFFMSVTVFRRYQGLRVELPVAKATKKLEGRRSITYIWIDTQKRINIDDVMVNLSDVGPVIRAKLDKNPAIIVSIRADKRVPYRYVAEVMEELKKVGALRVNFGTQTERLAGGG
jgi:biopolymer transport protein TolR